MSTEKHDPWALLREARDWVGGWSGILPMAGKDIDALRARIDDALAEHDVEDKVEWTQDALGYYARVKVEAEIEVFQDLSGEWQWNRTALSDVRRHGSANTLDEAQRAALAAARGMK